MTLESLLSDVTVLCTFLLLGYVILHFVKQLQKFFLPAAVVGGTVALLCGPQVLNLVPIPSSFSKMSSVLINVIPCAAVFGSTINRSKLRTYGDFLCVYLVTYGVQMVVSAIVGVGCEQIWPNLPHGWGIMALYSFWGGHGTAAAAGGVFEQLDIQGNTQIGMIMSTIGLVTAMVGGMIIINLGVRKNYTQKINMSDTEKITGVIPSEERHPIGMERVSSISINNFMFQLSLIMFCILFGTKIMDIFKNIMPFVKSMPSMVDGILGALILWPLMQKVHLDDYVDKLTVNTIAGLCLEFVVLSAIATLNLKLLADYVIPIAIMSIIIIICCFIFSILYTKKISRQDWFEKGIGSFGQTTGSISTGLALVRCVDPNSETSAPDAMGIANSVTAPLYSTMAAIGPLILVSSLPAFIGIGSVIFLVPFIFSLMVLAKK